MLQHVKAGKLRVLAHWGTARLETMPEVPSLKQSATTPSTRNGLGVFARGTPSPSCSACAPRARAAAATDEGQGSHHECRSPVLYQDTPDFEKYVQNDVRRMADVVKKIGKVQ